MENQTYIDYSNEINDKNRKLKIGDNVRISKYKNVFAKDYAPNQSKEVFVIKKVKHTVSWTYVMSNLKGEGIVGNFYEKQNAKKQSKKNQIEKVIKRKDDKLYVK